MILVCLHLLMSLAGTPGIEHFAARLPEQWLPVLWWGICESERCGRVPVRTVPSGRMSAQGLHHHSHGEEELLSHSAEAIWPHLKTENEGEGKNDFHRTQSLKTHITLHKLLRKKRTANFYIIKYKPETCFWHFAMRFTTVKQHT